jgi:hypothetical protein
VGGDPAEALSASRLLREAGWRVALSQRVGLELVREAERSGAVEALLAEGGSIVRLDRAGERALALERPLPYPPTTSWAEEGEQR